jgi:hypothetical protein
MHNVRRFVSFVFLVAIAGCSGTATGSSGGTMPSTGAQSAIGHSWMAPNAASGDLLYVSDDGYGSVMVYSYGPHSLQFVGVLATPSFPGQMCVDKAQNVWIVTGKGGSSYAATEYAHGGTTPIAVLMDPAGVPTGCAIDPTTGNLALSSTPKLRSDVSTIAIYRHERGKPKLYQDASIPGFYECCTYDHRGNLYGYGTENTHSVTILSELAKGSNSFTPIELDREITFLYGMQWVGKYLTIGESDGERSGSILEYTISKSGTATFAKEIALPKVTELEQYFIDRNRIIAPNISFEGPGFVGLYNYATGGLVHQFEFSQPVAVAVSRATAQ